MACAGGFVGTADNVVYCGADSQVAVTSSKAMMMMMVTIFIELVSLLL